MIFIIFIIIIKIIETLEMTNKAMKVYEKQGRFQNAAKIQKKLAEQFEQEMKYELAIHSYKKAADYFTMENSNFKVPAIDLIHFTCAAEPTLLTDKPTLIAGLIPLLKSSLSKKI